MGLISNKAIDLIEPALAQPTSAQAGRAFFDALNGFGVTALFARAYRASAAGPDHDEHVFARVSPPGWERVYDEKPFRRSNFLTRAIRQRAAPFRWSDVELASPEEKTQLGMLAEHGFPDGFATPCHGPGGYVAVVSLGLSARPDLSPAERTAIDVASVILHNRMRELSPLRSSDLPKLSRRERDCIGFIADGKSDWEISVILGVSHTTVISHVQNAKRKLGAATRAQAVARCLTAGLL